ncbi:MAG: DUF4173 domain-containing protein [Actinomycetota bacterium]|nr:DUF4173 domain-containing protein [Actinomycetota bacterium]
MAKTPPTPADNAPAKYLPIFAVSFLLGLAFDYLLYGEAPGLSFPVYIILIGAAFFILAARFKMAPDKSVILLIIPLVFFSAMVFVRASEFLTLLNVGISLLFLILIADLAVGLKLKDYFIVDYIKSCFLVPVNALDKFFLALSNIPAVLGAVKDRDRASQIIRGVLLAVPVLILFILLLSSADLVFHKYASKLIDVQITPESVFRTILVLGATAAFIGTFTYLFIKPERIGAGEPANPDRQSLGLIEGSILLGSVNALFLSFILVQVAYLFGGRRNIAVKGVTYAQYARRGFFELIAVAAISFLLIWLTEKYIFRRGEKHALSFTLLGGALIVQVIVIMISAFKRLALYEGAYGYTVLRFYSHVFIIWLAVVFLLLLVKIFTNEEENFFALRMFTSGLIFLAFLNFFNPDAFIAGQNIARYKETGKLDAWYLSRLSADALPETIKVLDIKDQGLSRDFAAGSYWQWQNEREWANRWQSINLSRRYAYPLLSRRATFLKQNKDRQPPALSD